MMDEYEASMATTEWLAASTAVRQSFMAQYEKHRQYLAAIQDAQMASVQSQMLQGAVAQATQQAAAKGASVGIDTAIAQIQAQFDAAQQMSPRDRLMQAMQGGTQVQPRRPTRPSPPSPLAPGPAQPQ
jgi:hypothetical protein